MKPSFLALILAAGKGTRFKSNQAKVLHPILGKSMIRVMVDSISRLKPERIHLVVGYQREKIMQETFPGEINFIIQEQQLGTGHAVMAARSVLKRHMEQDLLVINGDLPLVRPETLRPLLAQHRKERNDLTFMSSVLDDPAGFGRLVTSEDGKIKVIEEKDATPSQRKEKEANIGIYMLKIQELLKALPKISNKNVKGEYYLTDIIEIISSAGKKVGVHRTEDIEDFVGINDRFELARAANILRRRRIQKLTEKGVTFYDPVTTWIDLDVKIGRDSVVYPSVIIEGNSEIGRECKLYPSVHIIDSKVGDRVNIFSSTMIEESTIGNDAKVGPFSHLRPKSVLMPGSKVGNFVEMKNSVLGKSSKAMHLTYVGDSIVGEKVNIGAGTITCNYDGRKKHKTIIKDGVFIGSGTQLIAPIKIGEDAYIGAGSTITKDVSPGALAVTRSKQTERKGWARRRKKK
jgi:bifunctional UDP-N-acetylglucosamine pyrophosphorylase/glucosamine-1-phosphate N-acetyltransferase